MRHVISLLLQNEAGALTRVANLFSSRGYNIESLSVAPTQDETISRLTLVTSGSEQVVTQITRQLEKLIDVVSIADMTSGEHIERELGLLKLQLHPEAESAVRELAQGFEARILDDRLECFTMEVSASEQRIDDLLSTLPAGVEILAVVRSGPMAVSRGPQSMQRLI